MKLVANAVLPFIDGDLPKTVGTFVSFLRDHCTFDIKTKCSLSLITTRGYLLNLVARAVPADAGEFENCARRMRRMTAAQFLAQSTAKAKGDNSACDVTLTEFLSQEQIVALLSELARSLPKSGRSIFLIVMVSGAVLHDVSREVRGRVSLSRTRLGKRQCGSSLFCELEAKSKSDPAAKQTFQELGQALGVEWKKLSVMPDFDRADRAPSSEMMVVEQCIQEAFAQAATDLDRAETRLDGGPRLYSPIAALHKRMGDVTGGGAEKIDFGRRMRQFMLVNFPDYKSCRLGGSGPAFRKRLGDHLNGMIVVEREGGFGKCFTLQYGVEFPGTRIAGSLLGARSLFSLLHKGLLPPVWAYTTSADLEQGLGGCGKLLGAALPVLEARLTEYLSPVPESLPATMEIRGRLSAREAYEEAQVRAKEWAPDSRFLSVHSGVLGVSGYEISRGVDLDGRLQPHGRWVVRFDSKRLGEDLLVAVPHTGQIEWNSMVQVAPLLFAPPSSGWLDSPVAIERGIEAIKGLVPGREWKTWECGILEERSIFAAVWRIRASFGPSSQRPDFRDAYVYLNPVDGSVVHSLVEER